MNLNKILRSTISELSKAGIKTADIDARAILRAVVEKDDVYIITHSDDLLTNAQYQKFRRYIRRRKQGEPLAYIIGQKEFYSLDFMVNKNVLIPRPETESLVDQALSYLKIISPKNQSTDQPIDIIDIGTGSGCIIISLIKNLPTAIHQPLTFFASDISLKALNTAKNNAKTHEVYDDIQFFKSDLFNNPRLPNKFDLIIANLPYLDESNFCNKDHSFNTIGLNYEPKEALFAKEKGVESIKKLIISLPLKLNRNGLALIESDPSQTQLIEFLCSKNGSTLKKIDNANKFKGLFAITLKYL